MSMVRSTEYTETLERRRATEKPIRIATRSVIAPLGLAILAVLCPRQRRAIGSFADPR